MNYIYPSKFEEIASDSALTAEDLIGLASWTLNDQYPVDGLSVAFMDLSQYSFDDWGALTVTAPTNSENVTLTGGTIKSSDGKSSITLTTAKASSTYTEGVSYSQSGSYKLSMSLASGVTFSLDATSTYKSDEVTGAMSNSETLIVSFKDTLGTTGTTDDTTISLNRSSTYSEGETFSTGKGSETYSYAAGSNLTISNSETWNENLTYAESGLSGTFTGSTTYSIKDQVAGIEIGFKADSTGGMVDDGNGGKSFGETIKFSGVTVADPTGKMTAVSLTWSFPYEDGPDVDLIGTGSPGDIAGGLAPFFVPLAAMGANVITLNNVENIYVDAGAGNDTITGGTMGDEIDDGAGDDMVNAGAGDDTLYAGLGNDTLNGGDGSDLIYAGGVYDEGSESWLNAGKDVIDGGAGNDLVVMSMWEGSYALSKSGTDLILTNGAANVVTVKNTVERIQFGDTDEMALSDLMAGAASSGNDVLYQRGSGSYDTTTKVFAPDGAYQGGPANIDGLAGNDTIFGTDMLFTFTDGSGQPRNGGDILRGGDGADSLVSFSGSDILDGGAGNDTLVGGLGANLYIVDATGDVIRGEETQEFFIGTDQWLNGLQVKGNISYTLATGQNVEYLSAGEYSPDAYTNGSNNPWTFTNTNAASIKGNDFNQWITGNAAVNTLDGSGGDDSIWGAGGNDILIGGAGNDTLDGGTGNDSVSGGDGDDVVSGDFGDWSDATSTYGFGGKDTLDGGAGNDLAFMQYGESSYSLSKSGSDLVLTNVNDKNSVTTIKNTVEYIKFFDTEVIGLSDLTAGAASSGNDVLYQRGSGSYDATTKVFTADGAYEGKAANIDGLDGNDSIFGTDAVFTIETDSGPRGVGDNLQGGKGTDSLVGFAGDDLLDGGEGNDTLNGGAGIDLYIVDSVGDVIQGEDNRDPELGPLDFENYSPLANYLQVKGAINYKLTAGQYVEGLFAGEFNGQNYANGLDPWTFSNTNAASITGNDFNQLIRGNAAVNTLDGSGGDDSIWGAGGNDILIGGAGNDTLDGGTGDDSVSGGDGDDVVSGDFGDWSDATSTYGFGGKDTLDGGAGNDLAFMQYGESSYSLSKSGSDLVLTNVNDKNSITTIKSTVEYVQFGADGEFIALPDLTAGAASSGNDVLYQRGSGSYDATTKVFTADGAYEGKAANIDGLDGNDSIFGTDAVFTIETDSGPRGVGDNLQGGKGTDSLVGFAGDDLLDGGEGNDTLNGGAGIDLYIVDSVGDVIQGEDNRDPELGPLDFENYSPLANYLQVKGAINYKLTAGQYVEGLFAGEFNGQNYANGLDPWTFSNTNAASITGNDFNQLIRGNAAVNTLDGSGGDDSIWGAGGNDILIGGAGNDTLDGGTGDDSVSGGDGDDVVSGDFGDWSDATSTYGFGGKDTLDGGAGNDLAFMQYGESSYSLSKSGSDLVLTNVNDKNSITTIKSTVEYVQFGADGEFIALPDLTAGAASSGNDVLYQRGSGSYDATTKVFTADGAYEGKAANIDGLGGNDAIFGTSLNDTLFGGAGDDSIQSFDGNDKLNGGVGKDTLIGGKGIDHYFVDDAGDVVVELASDDADQATFSFGGEGDAVVAVVNYTLGAGVAAEDLIAAGIWTGDSASDNKAINLTGNERDNGVIGNSAANLLDGGAGNDALFGGAGNDTLRGGVGDDILLGGLGKDSLDGGAGNDWFAFNLSSSSSNGYDLLMNQVSIALTGDTDTMVGGAGIDVLAVSGSVNDYTFTRSSSKEITVTNKQSKEVAIIDGIEFVVGDVDFSNGQDPSSLPSISIASLLTASSFDDDLSPRDLTQAFVVDGLAGNDTLTGTDQFGDTLAGGGGNDSLVGQGGDDSLDGGAGNDALLGGDGRDTLWGGAGNDTMTGGTGNDRYWIDSAGDVVIELLDPAETNADPDTDGDVAIVATTWASGPTTRLESLIAAGELASKFLQMPSSVAEAKVDITGNGFDERIIGSGEANKLDGGGGNDFIFGSDGADTLLGGTGNDSLAGGAGNDSLSGGIGNDVFLFNQDIKLLNAGAGFTIADVRDRITGGTDTIDGGEGTDLITLSGQEGDYVISRVSQTDYRIEAKAILPGAATKESALLRGVEGLIFTGTEANPDVMTTLPPVLFSQLGIPSDFDDNLSPRDDTQRFDRNGGKGNDTITGSLVGDSLEGGDGNDSLAGGGGNDTLMGGAGNDILVVSRPNELTPSPSPTPVTEMITMDGGAGDDTFVIDGLAADRVLTILDTAGKDTVRFNVYDGDNADLDVFVDGASNKVNVFIERDSTGSPAPVPTPTPTPLAVVNTGLIERFERHQYEDVNGQSVLTDTVSYNAVYATKDAKTGAWNAKGTDTADVILATTGGANVYDGGKGDDLIMAWAHEGSVVQGGEGFNDISVRYGVPGQPLVSEVPIGTLSYAWSSGGVEVNMAAGIGVAYDTKGEEVLGVDQFERLANVLGGKGGDSLVGDGYNNILDGSDGNDTLSGGGGLDVLLGGAGNDTFVVNLQDAGTVASERVGGTANASGEGNLSLSGGTDAKGTDTLVVEGLSRLEDVRVDVSGQTVKLGMVTPSADPANPLGVVSYTVLADRGIEQVSFDLGTGAGPVYATTWGNLGTKGNDLVLAKAVGGYAVGGLGNDLVLGGSGEDVLLGGLGNDVLIGQGGEDRLLGGLGNDTIRFNRLDGDIVLGGAGSDTFVIGGVSEDSAGYASRVLDFRLNEDFLLFEGYTAVSFTVGNTGSITATKGIDGVITYGAPVGNPGETLLVRLDGVGNLDFDTASSEVDVQLVGIAGIDTQAELAALMSRVVLG